MTRKLFAAAVLTTLAALPLQAESYKIDPSHSEVGFTIRHMVSNVRGRFNDFSGTIDMDPKAPQKGSVEFSVKTTSIDTGNADRDKHLRTADFFDVEKYPEIVFTSSAVFPKGEGKYAVSGQLKIREISRPVTFDVELEGIGVDGQGGRHLGAAATITIDRKDFGLVWNQPIQNGMLVGDKVKIDIGLEALDAASAKAIGVAA
jgi:polyisoprenoid-binding protein YceI